MPRLVRPLRASSLFVIVFLFISGFVHSAKPSPESRSAATELPQAISSPQSFVGPPIWGAGASVGSSDGEFANAFVQATSFAAGNNPNSWTALSVNQSSGAVTPGAAFWIRSLTGVSQGAYAGGMPVVTSPSQVNGVAIFDSDFMDNGGVQGAFGAGTSPSPHRGELISPRIDLTGRSGAMLAVRFYTFYRQFSIVSYSVAMSSDDGATWTQPVNIRTLIGDSVQGFAEASFPNVTAGVVDMSRFRIKFIFDGDYYFAIVDDVSLGVVAPIDLALGQALGGTGTTREKGDVVHFTNSRYFPITQISSRDFAFGAHVRNLGTSDLQVSQSGQLQIRIDRNVAGNWTTVVTDTTAINEVIPAGGYVTVLDTLTDTSWLEPGDYRATYTASYNGSEDTSNNAREHFFSITHGEYASKVDREVNGDPLATQSVITGQTDLVKVEFGSVFYFDATATGGQAVDALSLKYRVPVGFNGPADQVLQANVYTIDASQGTLNDRSLLTQIGTCTMTLNGLGTTTAAGQYGVTSCRPLNMQGGALPALATGHYFFAVALARSPVIVNLQVPHFGGSNVKNYLLNATNSAAGTLQFPSPVAVTTESGIETFFQYGFSGNVTPSLEIRLVMPNAVFRNGFE